MTAVGPLDGLRVVEIAGIGPAPFTGMMLADMGAEVIRVDRIEPRAQAVTHPANVLRRGRHSIAVDLKHSRGRAVVLDLAERSDAIFEPFRPGVAERLGIGPDTCLARNSRLVYGRMTGWGQDGPLAAAPGHDINYIALAGALEPLGRRGEPPLPPLNLLGDFAGGGMLLAFGLLCGLLQARASGEGQVVSAAMVDGAALLMSMFHAFRGLGAWSDERGTNELDSGSHYYQVYETADGVFVAVGAIEPLFYRALLAGLGLDEADFPQHDRAAWPAFTARFAAIFATRSRAEWMEAFEGTDACVTPVLTMAEARHHPHNVARGVFRTVDGVAQPAPAPRFSHTPGDIRWASPRLGAHTDEVLGEVLGYSAAQIRGLRADRVVG